MAASGPAADVLAAGAVRRRNPVVAWSVGVAGCAAAALSASLILARDDDLPSTLGEALVPLPVVLFLHVFLVYPSGRLERRFERLLVAGSYVAAIGVGLGWIVLAGAATVARLVQLLGVSSLVLVGIGALVARRRDNARPLRLHDRAMRDEPELLDAVTAAAGIALENERLHVELRARLEELRESRARVIEAEQKERQRLERNLHDGVQQRLVALSLDLDRLEHELEPYPDAVGRLTGARREIAASLEELRELARGIHPAVVTGHGLAVALEELAAHASVPVRLHVNVDGRLPERLEIAAYYLVSESLANIGKHAHATSATIEVSRKEGRFLVEVIDDGVGGADTERGSGLRGLADRVEALGGRLRVWSTRGGGTRVRAEMPCAS